MKLQGWINTWDDRAHAQGTRPEGGPAEILAKWILSKKIKKKLLKHFFKYIFYSFIYLMRSRHSDLLVQCDTTLAAKLKSNQVE